MSGETESLRAAINRAVEAYAALVQFNLLVPGEERALMYGAAKQGVTGDDSERLAWQIADFLPLALARRELADKGVVLDDHYARVDSQGRLRTYRLLKDEPVYRQAAELETELRASHSIAVSHIAKISVEYQNVHAALQRGSRAADLELGPPILNGPDELCDPLAQQPRLDPEPWWLSTLKQQKPWWKFW